MSFVRSFLRSSSLSREQPAPSTDPSTPKTGSPRSPFGISTVPSFNDFSMHIGQEADTDYGQPAGAGRRSESLDVARDSMDSCAGDYAGLTQGVSTAKSWTPGVGWDPSRLLGRSASAAIAIPGANKSVYHGGEDPTTVSSSVPVGKPDAPATPARRNRKGTGKINGMDYWEFCELIRSSSL